MRVWRSRELGGPRGGSTSADRACVEKKHFTYATVTTKDGSLQYAQPVFSESKINCDTMVESADDVLECGVAVELFPAGGKSDRADKEHAFKGRTSIARMSSPCTGPGVDHRRQRLRIVTHAIRMPRSGKHTHVKMLMYDHCAVWSNVGGAVYIFNFFAATFVDGAFERWCLVILF